MPKVNMHKNLLITLWELNRYGKEEQNSIIQRAVKVCKTFEVKSLTRPKLHVPAKKIAYSLFYEDIREKKRVEEYHCFAGKCYHIDGIEKG